MSETTIAKLKVSVGLEVDCKTAYMVVANVYLQRLAFPNGAITSGLIITTTR